MALVITLIIKSFSIAANYVLLSLLLADACDGRWQSVDHKMSTLKNVSLFYRMLQGNQAAKLSVHYREVTILAATNDAVRSFGGKLTTGLISYHVASGVHTLGRMHVKLHPVVERYPPIWITRSNDDVYVNNARILPHLSNYRARNRYDRYGKEQVLHVIDEVLRPIDYAATAYALMENWARWRVDRRYAVESFRKRTLSTGAHVRYASENATATFLVPIDDSTANNVPIDSYTIRGHIVPGVVLFTRPLLRHFPYETLANDGDVNVVVVFFEIDGTLYAKSRTLRGDANHPVGEVTAEIVHANVPVVNGVVHLIRNPLMAVATPLKKFPHLPVYDKLAMDPYLNVTYRLGETVAFNERFKDATRLYTYFVPSDAAWRRLVERLGADAYEKIVERAAAILGAHVLVGGNEAYTMKKLAMATHGPANGTYFRTLNGAGVVLKATRTDDSDEYRLTLDGGTSVAMRRADYECTNGIVHVIDDVLLTDDDLVAYGLNAPPPVNKVHVLFNLMKLFGMV